MLLLATSQGKSKTSGGIISDSLDENKIRDRELLNLSEFFGVLSDSRVLDELDVESKKMRENSRVRI